MGTLTALELGVNGTFLDVSDRLKYIHLGNEGFGIPPLERFTEQGPFQDGVTDIGFRLSARSIQLVLMALSDGANNYFERRDEILYYLTPRASPLQLRFTRSDSSVRQIDCYVVGGATLPSQDKYGFNMHKIGVQLQAPDPTFYNPVMQQISFGIDVTSNQFAIPWSFPWNIGSSVLNQTTAINYTGSYKTYPMITIYGPVTNLVITNTTTGDKLDFTGSTIGSGQIYTIDTRYGFKTVRDATNTSQISKLTTDSDLSTFALLARPEAPDGINTINVVGTGANSSTQVYMSYYERFIGA